MELWEQDFVDLEGPGYIRFRRGGTGDFHFGAVQGWMDWRFAKRNGEEAAEFSWEGTDEMDRVCGRGWVVLEGDRIHGRLFFHMSDDSSFVAEKE